MKLLDGLIPEQIKALMLLQATPHLEASEVCERADCSWDELARLWEVGLINPGSGRIAPNRLHPVITTLGLEACDEAELAGYQLHRDNSPW
jgi:hypothetical protein